MTHPSAARRSEPRAGLLLAFTLRMAVAVGLERKQMTSRLDALCFHASDPRQLAGFWAGVLGWDMDTHAGIVLLPSDDTGFRIRFLPSQEPKVGENQMHFHLTSTSLADQQQTVQRSLALGARHLDVGQRPEEGHVVLADPDGNEFCVIEPGNRFLADCGFLGELACDGSHEVGYFWSAALGWPLVWDQDQETAIRSPHGGPKIAWGGPPVSAKAGKNRLHFDLTPPVDGDQQTEVDRLVSLGAARVDVGQGRLPWVVMADPDGNEFRVLWSLCRRRHKLHYADLRIMPMWSWTPLQGNGFGLARSA
jgi:catechol 2,3-dioxygenase-like lactoylglutathione lyase family enzyme